ncbi:hypothetical protein AYI69_g4115 [Smittium culicis]|uniref:Secreted protein n=1 Tax=Smittium culicis TaxID=133412 RepID=A0A1R1YGD2_9FUNG|nr:hypothetical protein AYI69_g4115 [Smittium culicis]
MVHISSLGLLFALLVLAMSYPTGHSNINSPTKREDSTVAADLLLGNIKPGFASYTGGWLVDCYVSGHRKAAKMSCWTKSDHDAANSPAGGAPDDAFYGFLANSIRHVANNECKYVDYSSGNGGNISCVIVSIYKEASGGDTCRMPRISYDRTCRI